MCDHCSHEDTLATLYPQHGTLQLTLETTDSDEPCICDTKCFLTYIYNKD